MSLDLLLVIQLILLAIIILPLYYDMRISYTKNRINLPPKTPREFDGIRIILPMRNEAGNVNRIITLVTEEISQEDNCCVTLIDSNSSDATRQLAIQAFQKSTLCKDRWEVIYSDQPNKSRSINLVLESTNSELYIMIDADVRPNPGWYSKIKHSMSCDDIGVVSGVESKHYPGNSMIRVYKSYSTKLRLKQSNFYSTPILEGGLMSWKRSTLRGFRLNESSNADDAQIAINAFRNGYRTVIIGDLTFQDLGGSMGNARRSIRRSQGLSRTLLKNTDLWLMAPSNRSRIIFRHIFALYILFPWSMVLFFSNSIFSIAFGNPTHLFWPYISLFSFLILMFSQFGRSALWGVAVTIIGQFLFLFGIKFSYWDTFRNHISE